MATATADFNTLLRLSGLKKCELADALGVGAGTISTWGNAAPKYATAYLQLVVDLNIGKKELSKAQAVITDYVNAKLTLKEIENYANNIVTAVKTGTPPPKV